MRYDAVIVGAGPAGSAAARLLAEAGWSVALVEKAEFPRRKVCGEFISATTMPVLKACGVAVPFIAAAGPPVTRVGVYAGNAMLSAPREQVWGRALGREHLDVMLRDAAVAAGATLFQPAEVTAVDARGDGYRLRAGGRLCADPARIVIAACGSWNAQRRFRGASRRAEAFRSFRLQGAFHPKPAAGRTDAAAGFSRRLWRAGAERCRAHLAVLLHPPRCAGPRAPASWRQGGETRCWPISWKPPKARVLALGACRAGQAISCPPARSIPASVRARTTASIFTGNIAGEAHPVIAEGISMAIQSSGLLAELADRPSRRTLCAGMETPLCAAHPGRGPVRPACHARAHPRRQPGVCCAPHRG